MLTIYFVNGIFRRMSWQSASHILLESLQVIVEMKHNELSFNKHGLG